jgi:hypothetical protein
VEYSDEEVGHARSCTCIHVGAHASV